MGKVNRDNITFIVIYLLVFSFIIYYNLTHPVINDGVAEYRNYLLNIEEGWKFRITSVNSCLVTVWLPSIIQRITSCDPMFIFRIIPPFFYALMPAFVFLIARKYLDFKGVICSTLVIIFSSYILFFPDVGRVGVGLGFFAGLVWALLSKRLYWALTFSILLVFSHYGTVIIAIGLVLAVFCGSLLFKRIVLWKYLITLIVLVISTWLWHFEIAKHSGDVMMWVVFQPESQGLSIGSMLDMGARDLVTQEFFGANIFSKSIPALIELVSNWIIVFFITLGMIIVLFNKKIDYILKLMMIALYGLILATIAIPLFSVCYGTQRVYFTACTVLAICFPIGADWISKKIYVYKYCIMISILVIYGLSVYGITYSLFGLEKVLPVYFILP